METPQTNSSVPPRATGSGDYDASGVGPAGRRAHTPWNSSDRQREFGSLDADPSSAPQMPSTPPARPTGGATRGKPSRPTWPIAVAIAAILAGGIAFLAKHPAKTPTDGKPSTTSTTETKADSGKTKSPASGKPAAKPASKAVTKKVREAERHHSDESDSSGDSSAATPHREAKPHEVRPRPKSPVADHAAPPESHPVAVPVVPVAAPRQTPAPPRPVSVVPAPPDTASQRAQDLLK